ncbi:MAG: hypothetical protein WAM14_23390 [Candidatus Nitrosopolaris sp.]
MDKQKEEERRKSITDSNARLIHEDEKWSKFISANESEIIYHDNRVVHGFFSQCDNCWMWVKVIKSEELDHNAPIVRQIPLNRTAYGKQICDRCWGNPKYEKYRSWITTLLEKHVINPSPAYDDIDKMSDDGYNHLLHIGLAGPCSSGPGDDDYEELLDDFIEFIDCKKNIFPKECKTVYDRRRWIHVAVARELHKNESMLL